MPTSEEDRDIKISKSLSYLLRHGAVKEKLDIDASGFILLADLLKHQRLKSHKTTISDIERIVENNDKKRFSIVGDKICANQGHSLKVVKDDNLEELTKDTIPSKIFHGTYLKKLPLILPNGLSKMNRNHIHFTYDLESISGIRKSANILIYIDTEKCFQNGIKFFKSSNGVILSPGDNQGFIKSEYFDKIVKVNGEEVKIDEIKNESFTRILLEKSD